MAKDKVKVDSLEQALLNAEVDLTYDKPRIMDTEEGLVNAATAWTNNEQGIRAVLESRAMELRHKILFTCTPVELPALRERLVEIANIIKSFKDVSAEAERRAKLKDEEQTEQQEAAEVEEEETEDVGDNSSM